LQGETRLLWGPGDKPRLHSGIINLFDERIVYSPDKDYVCSKRGIYISNLFIFVLYVLHSFSLE
jgi:hypothetical protein